MTMMPQDQVMLDGLWTVTGISKESGQVVQRWVVWANTRERAVQAVEAHGILATEEELSAAPFEWDIIDEATRVAINEV